MPKELSAKNLVMGLKQLSAKEKINNKRLVKARDYLGMAFKSGCLKNRYGLGFGDLNVEARIFSALCLVTEAMKIQGA